jgi:NAD(P)-dependent dehydrogenase (short-subunit alcohol dehydrogenase family)
VAVVTGGARRLGRHLCERLAARGYHVVIVYRRSEDDAAAVVSQLQETGCASRAIQADISRREDVSRLFADVREHEGRVDVLINNVGNYTPQDVTALDPDVWDATIAANLSGAFYCCHFALPLMPYGGQIISIGMAGLEGMRANRIGADYYVSKAGLLVLTRALAAGYADRHVRVNMVSPGHLENSIDLPSPDTLPQQIPLGRPGSLRDISQAVEYLLDAPYVTGVNLDVAGGYRL